VTDIALKPAYIPAVWKKNLPIIAGMFLIILGLGTATLPYITDRDHVDLEVAELAEIATQPNIYENINLEARSAIVYDIKSGEIFFGRNEDVQLPLASIAKIMTALVAVHNKSGDDTVKVASGAFETEGATSLAVGERWHLSDLIDQTLVSSSNTGAVAIAMSVGSNIGGGKPTSSFVDFMNTYAAELGLEKTYFLNPTGLDEGHDLAGAYGSALDVARLLSFITKYNPELIRATGFQTVRAVTLDNVIKDAKNTNTSIQRLPFLRAGKTGYTDLAGGNLAIVFDVGLDHPVVAVVLGSSIHGRFTDIERLVQATFLKYKLQE